MLTRPAFDTERLSDAGRHVYELTSARSLSSLIPYRPAKDLTVFVPCYNEEGNIVDTFHTIVAALSETALTWEIIVIDDASRDRSREIIISFIDAHPEYDIRLMVRPENRGLAQNYLDGAFLARGKYYKLVSGDNAEPKDTLLHIFRSLGRADMVVPYHVAIEGRSLSRHVVSNAYTFIVNTLNGYKIKYYNGGALHLTCYVMRWHTDYHGYSFQADIITRLLDSGMTYIEIPVTSQERKSGVSQAIRVKNFLSVAHFFLDLVIRRVGRRYRGR